MHIDECMKTIYLILAAAIWFTGAFASRALAQTDSATVARELRRANVQLDSAQNSRSAAANTLRSAQVAYGAAMELLKVHDYAGASRLAGTAASLAQSAGRGISEFGPQPDTIPFGVERVPPAVPPIKPDTQATER
jgi:hypothetical protein